jgi:hypothetical protein
MCQTGTGVTGTEAVRARVPEARTQPIHQNLQKRVNTLLQNSLDSMHCVSRTDGALLGQPQSAIPVIPRHGYA